METHFESSPAHHWVEPRPPWELRGECVVAFAPRGRIRAFVRYAESPVGPYLEHALARWLAPSRTRPRVWGPHVEQMSVDLEASRRAGRAIWGFPKTLESLAWKASRPDAPRSGAWTHIDMRRGASKFRARVYGPRLSLRLRGWTVQRHQSGTWMRVPTEIRAKARLATLNRVPALHLAFTLRIGAPQPVL